MALTGVAAISVDKFGRKPLILLSGLGTCISIVALGIYFYLDENKNCVSNTEIQPPLIFNQSKIFEKLAMEFFSKYELLLYTSFLVNSDSFYGKFTNTIFQKIPSPHLICKTIKDLFNFSIN